MALAHIPSKKNPPQAIMNPDSPGISDPTTGIDEDSGSDATRNESPNVLSPQWDLRFIMCGTFTQLQMIAWTATKTIYSHKG